MRHSTPLISSITQLAAPAVTCERSALPRVARYHARRRAAPRHGTARALAASAHPWTGQTPLHTATFLCQQPIIDALIDAGAVEDSRSHLQAGDAQAQKLWAAEAADATELLHGVRAAYEEAVRLAPASTTALLRLGAAYFWPTSAPQYADQRRALLKEVLPQALGEQVRLARRKAQAVGVAAEVADPMNTREGELKDLEEGSAFDPEPAEPENAKSTPRRSARAAERIRAPMIQP